MSFYRSPFVRLVLTGSFLAAAAFVGCSPGDDAPPDLSKRDTDNDGIPDSDDPDIDNDGIPNAQDPDVDGDGILNGDDPDFGVKPVDGGISDDVGIGDDSTTGTGGGGPVTQCKIDPVTNKEVCSCFQLQTWGALGTFGAVPGNDGTDAISAWLNLNSSGEASYTATKPVITAESLRPYKVIIIQNISAWAPFTAEEKAAAANWVKVDGGGIISLNGYTDIALPEMTNVNDLLSFTGMSYVPGSDTSNEDERTATLGACQDCFGSSVPQAGWTTHPIGANIKKVGAFHGRAVSAGSATVVANNGSVVLGAAGEYEKGRVFMFHDEWVTYNSQWTGQGIPYDCSMRQGCETQTPIQQYTIPQFWFNSLKWLSNLECFDITAPGIVK